MKAIEINATNGEYVAYPTIRYQTSLYKLIPKLMFELLKVQRKDRRIVLLCTGTSGLVPAVMLSTLSRQFSYMYFRKEGENSHDGVDIVEPYEWSNSEECDYVIIDDLIASGGTMQYIINKAEQLGIQSIYATVFTSFTPCAEVSAQFKGGNVKPPKYNIYVRRV